MRIGIFLFIFYGGIYICPERIKFFAFFYTVFLIWYYFWRYKDSIRISIQWLPWYVFLILGFIATVTVGNGKIEDAAEFVVAVIIGLLSGCVYVNEKDRGSQIHALKWIGIVALIGCGLQIFASNLLMTINQITLGSEKYIMFHNFFSWGYMVGFSYQTGVTGYYLTILEIIIISHYFTEIRKKRKIQELLLFMFIYGLILMTGKRSELLAIFIITISMVCIFNRKKRAKILFTALICVFGLSIIMFLTPMGQRMIDRTLSNPLTGRMRIYSVLLEYAKNHPLLGSGFGSTLETVKDFTNGHNIYLQVLMENGVVGFVILVLIISINLSQALKILFWRLREHKKDFIVTVCVGIQMHFILTGFIGNPLYDVFPLVEYLIVTGIIYSISVERKYLIRNAAG